MSSARRWIRPVLQRLRQFRHSSIVLLQRTSSLAWRRDNDGERRGRRASRRSHCMITCCIEADVRFVVAETVILRCVRYTAGRPPLSLVLYLPFPQNSFSTLHAILQPRLLCIINTNSTSCSHTSHSDLSSLDLSSQNPSTPPLPSCARHPLLPVPALRLFHQPSKQSLRPSLKPIRLLVLFLLGSKRQRKIYTKT